MPCNDGLGVYCFVFYTMVDRKNFNTTKAPKMSEFFPQAVIAGDYIFLSRTAGLNPESGKIISDDFEEQTRQYFLNMKIILEEAGSSMSKVIRQPFSWLPVTISVL